MNLRPVIVFTCVLLFLAAGTEGLLAHDLGAARPAKPARSVTPPPPDPAVVRQGGDTILDATALAGDGWVTFGGTTAGYTDDYDEVCPYTNSTSPDVVYTFVPTYGGVVDVDMYGSLYDTKIYIYDENLALVACNDDFYADYTSRLEMVPVESGHQYFLVIDGYGGDFGDYVGNLSFGYIWCYAWCPEGSEHENEPPLVDGYVDAWNGGCNSPEAGSPFQPITQPVFCGRTGYYLGADGGAYRDTDWFHLVIPAGGFLEIEGEADEASYMFELGPQECGSVAVIQSVMACTGSGTMTIVGEPGSLVWFWFGPQSFWDGYTYEYNYTLYLSIEPVAVEARNWSAIKEMFR
ncbi:MAG: hypothetical protein R3D98_02445 [Candidatus Krumholzibacteriia bacterium]